MADGFTARGVIAREPGKPGQIEEFTIDPLGPNDALVRILASGVCHSDLHLADGYFDLGGGKRLFDDGVRAAAAVLGAVTAVAVPAAAQAAPIAVDFNNVTGTTHLAKPNVDVAVPTSVVKTQVDLDAKTLTGSAAPAPGAGARAPPAAPGGDPGPGGDAGDIGRKNGLPRRTAGGHRSLRACRGHAARPRRRPPGPPAPSGWQDPDEPAAGRGGGGRGHRRPAGELTRAASQLTRAAAS